MKIFFSLLICLLTLSCKNNDGTNPKIIPNFGFKVTGSKQKIKIDYTNLDGQAITDTSYVPWKITFGKLKNCS